VIIEDDDEAEFRYDRDPVGAVHRLAADRVVQLGTVSKSAGAPGPARVDHVRLRRDRAGSKIVPSRWID
jgi:hypothetical protein